MTRARHRVSAVMASRSTKRDGREDFPTPPWAVRALLEHVRIDATDVIWEPCANRGAMVRPLRETRAAGVVASDLHDYGRGWPRVDFLRDDPPTPVRHGADWIITNPPFALGMEFARRALRLARKGVALLVRTSFLESAGRWAGLFRETPPAQVLIFTKRPVMLVGRLADPDVPVWHDVIDPEDERHPGEWKKPTTATSYAWMIWRADALNIEPALGWIDPQARERLTRPGDYEIEAPRYAAAPAAGSVMPPGLPEPSGVAAPDRSTAAQVESPDPAAGRLGRRPVELATRPGGRAARGSRPPVCNAGNPDASARPGGDVVPSLEPGPAGGETPGQQGER